VREALLDDEPAPTRVQPPPAPAPTTPVGPAPFDDEAT
jgi:sec-independent protein translocase protein TatB